MKSVQNCVFLNIIDKSNVNFDRSFLSRRQRPNMATGGHKQIFEPTTNRRTNTKIPGGRVPQKGFGESLPESIPVLFHGGLVIVHPGNLVVQCACWQTS